MLKGLGAPTFAADALVGEGSHLGEEVTKKGHGNAAKGGVDSET